MGCPPFFRVLRFLNLSEPFARHIAPTFSDKFQTQRHRDAEFLFTNTEYTKETKFFRKAQQATQVVNSVLSVFRIKIFASSRLCVYKVTIFLIVTRYSLLPPLYLTCKSYASPYQLPFSSHSRERT